MGPLHTQYTGRCTSLAIESEGDVRLEIMTNNDEGVNEGDVKVDMMTKNDESVRYSIMCTYTHIPPSMK